MITSSIAPKYNLWLLSHICLIALAALVCAFIFQSAASAFTSFGKGYHRSEFAANQAALSPQTTTDISYKLCFLGDNNLASYINDNNKNEDPYKFVHAQLNTCDIVIANLENNIATPGIGTLQPKGYNFTVPPERIKLLTAANIQVVSLANNHTMDFGPLALLDQMKQLTEHGVHYFGAGTSPAEAFSSRYILFHDIRIALIGANATENNVTNPKGNGPGSAYFNASYLATEIAAAKQNSDLVITFLHWGLENSTVVQQHEKTWAKFFIDHGVDLVVGAGPHVRQSVETYKGKQIFYSLGNYAVSGFAAIPEGSVGKVLEATLSNKQFTKYTTYDVGITYEGFPQKREGTEQSY